MSTADSAKGEGTTLPSTNRKNNPWTGCDRYSIHHEPASVSTISAWANLDVEAAVAVGDRVDDVVVTRRIKAGLVGGGPCGCDDALEAPVRAAPTAGVAVEGGQPRSHVDAESNLAERGGREELAGLSGGLLH